MNGSFVRELNQEKRNLLLKQVRRWGDLNTTAILDSHCKLFSIPSVEGCIGYRIENNCAIAFGDPLSAPSDQSRLADAFQGHCKDQGLNVIFAVVSENFSRLNPHRKLIQFGHKLILNPCEDPLKKTGPDSVVIRNKVKQASHSGVVIVEYLNEDPALEKAIEQVGIAWLHARKGPQIFIAHPNFFNDREGKRWFYAKRDNQVIGFLILNQLQACSGWQFNNLITAPAASTGTSELLITSVLKILETEKSQNVIIGPVVAKQIQQIAGFGTLSSFFVRSIFSVTTKIFHLERQTKFWEKFHPRKEPSYVMFDQLNFRTVKGLLQAMNVSLY